MLHRNENNSAKRVWVSLEQLVPKDHLLRKIDKYIDFEFIIEKVKPYYADNIGRPSIDPIVLFKMVFIGYLFGIRSMRQVVKEVETNIAYRWFLGFSLTDSVPHYSTFSQNYLRRFKDTEVFQEIFDSIVWQGIRKGLIDGKELFSDSTHLKANANKKKLRKGYIAKDAKRYLAELNKEIQKDREVNDKKPLELDEEPPEAREVKISTTDPESGYMVRQGKPEGFFYLDHRTVDGKHNLITDVYVTPANIHDSVPYLDRLERQMNTFGFTPGAVALDAGYFTAPISHALFKLGIFAVIAHRRFHPTKGLFPKWRFKYDKEQNHYVCPYGQELKYRTTNRHGFREYSSEPAVCRDCPYLANCTRSKTCRKIVTRHLWEDAKEWVRENRLSEYGKHLYRRRAETIERSFADAKELHGLRYARYRGRAKVWMQSLLTAACQNMKKIALILSRQDKGYRSLTGFMHDWRYLLTLMHHTGN